MFSSSGFADMHSSASSFAELEHPGAEGFSALDDVIGKGSPKEKEETGFGSQMADNNTDSQAKRDNKLGAGSTEDAAGGSEEDEEGGSDDAAEV